MDQAHYSSCMHMCCMMCNVFTTMQSHEVQYTYGCTIYI